MKLVELNRIDDIELKKEKLYDIISNIKIECNKYADYYNKDDDLIDDRFMLTVINNILNEVKQFKEL